MRLAIKLAFTLIYIFAAASAVYSIERPRKPYTRGQAIAGQLLCVLYLFGIWSL